MTHDELRTVVVEALASVAPEIDAAAIRPDVGFRDQLDLDSMDFLNFALALHDRLGVDIPEADYQKLSSLEAAVSYLDAKIAAAR